MQAKKRISEAVMRRLPRYLRYIGELKESGIMKVSSSELGEKMGMTASQIRQDFSYFGGFGQQGYGYNVEVLFESMKQILLKEKGFTVIIIGAGNLGTALAKYNNFHQRGFDIIGIFDINPKLIGKTINGTEIMCIDRLEDFIAQHETDIAILSLPRSETKDIASRVANAGVKGLFNFSPMDLKLPHEIPIENVHLSDSLMVLGYKIKNFQEEK
ncbi:MAG TPA: redox-sensing transcriptional repressor Rex [Clostridia bacterium]|jgi:redox-sensing transcriptional repressor|nr:redox-sensing transcriptional repressor Rex [Clostridia bacterium]NLV34856.1 redox-sensing transcriptional repressor Rex [Clostridiaceae bacterium]HPB17264.1 redox-sensing transcriptional repressor Rex [Clostridia bacterium]HQM97234.1 redox-sensing transcriptional repressor Rex [Clostridia bacterium]